jgi:hypothetical protein
MRKKHLSREQLIAFRDGELEDRQAIEHLAGCPDCQRAFDDSRWLLALARIREEASESEHPDRDELSAYLSQALSSRRAEGIARHLRTCDLCLARYHRLRRAEAALDYSSPAPALLRATQRRFRSRPRILELGALVLAKAGDAIGLLYRPAPELVPDEMIRDFAGLADRPRVVRQEKRLVGPPPLRKKRRAMAIREEQKLRKVRKIPAERIAEQTLSASPPAGARSPGSFTVVEAGPLALIFDAGLDEDRPVLSVLALDRESGDPRAGLFVVVEAEDGTRDEAVTKSDKAARLFLRRGSSTLLIRDRETYKLTIAFPE